MIGDVLFVVALAGVIVCAVLVGFAIIDGAPWEELDDYDIADHARPHGNADLLNDEGWSH